MEGDRENDTSHWHARDRTGEGGKDKVVTTRKRESRGKTMARG